VTGFIENNPVSFYYLVKNSAAFVGRSDRDWCYIASESRAEFKEMLSLFDKKLKCFGSLDEWMIPLLRKRCESEWILSAYNYYLPSEKILPERKIKIRTLREEDSIYIFKNSVYKNFLSVEYLSDRIKKSFSAGIFKDNKLAAWGLTHDDGAIGTLHVLDEHRNKGYGKEIVISLCNQFREKGRIPFAQITEDNFTSISLFTKLGFVKDRMISWMKLKD
jgi:8-oxo-dGTP diphosphatase